MVIELLAKFAAGIVGAILKKAAATVLGQVVGTAFKIYSVFEAVSSLHDCKDLGVTAVELAYDIVTDEVAERLVDQVVGDRFDVTRTDAGLYAVSRKVVPQGLWLPSPEGWQRKNFDYEYAFDFSRKFNFDFNFDFKYRFPSES
ncbi:MAG TPA: hypothetical protein VEK11_24945 [Thermoanaerobaculia bacterium]|nr:hypothetical protein [Thermoanaerobaculia bacterium]